MEIDILDLPVDCCFLDENVNRKISNIIPTSIFEERWKILVGPDINPLKDRLLNNFEINNPILKEDKYIKKYQYLSQARKLRWNSKTNKASQNGDIRIINSYIPEIKSVILILCYPKSKQEDITKDQAALINYTISMYKKEGSKSG